MGGGSRLKRHFNLLFFSRLAGQGASGFQEEQEGGEQGCGCVAGGGGSDTHQHNTRLANYFLWAFRKVTARPLQGFSGHTHTSPATGGCCSISHCAATISYCAATISFCSIVKFSENSAHSVSRSFLGFYIYICVPAAFFYATLLPQSPAAKC